MADVEEPTRKVGKDPLRQIRVDDERWERARATAEAQGISLAELVRRGIDHMVAEAPEDRDALTPEDPLHGAPR